VSKPETLDKRYLGKLSKTAISFMKQLIHPDPKQRLNDSNVFSHPYFNNYQDPFLAKDNVTKSNMSIKPKILQPIISNTTNINIINVNNQPEKNDKPKSLEKINNSNNMVLTSYNFNKNLKENMLSLYGNTPMDKNFKTFYKGDQYNFDLNLNYLNKNKKETIIEKATLVNFHKTSNSKPKEIDLYKSEPDKSISPPKKKTERGKTEDNQAGFKSKLNSLKVSGKLMKDFHLPYINNKNYLFTTRKNKFY
jgi:serine/threonine protein kinase